VSVHSTGVQQSMSPVNSDPARADNSVYPGSTQGSGRDQVVAGPLLGQVNYTVPIAGTPMYIQHVVPMNASAQGPRYVAVPPQSVSQSVVMRPTTVVRQQTTPPRATAPVPGMSMPPFHEASATTTCNYGVLSGSTVPFSSGVPFGSAVPCNTAIPTGSAVPLGTGILPNSTVTSATPGLAIPATPAVTPGPPEFQMSPVPSTVLHSAMPLTVQATTRSYVPSTTGYMRPWAWSASGSIPGSSVPAYGQTNGVSFPVGAQVATGRVAGLSEQARGTALVVPNQHPLADPTVSSVSATGSYTSPSVAPTGVSGWPDTVTLTVGPPGTVGGVMGLPEQARGTAQPTIMGIAGPIVRPPQPPNTVITQQPMPTVPIPAVGAAAGVPATVDASDRARAQKILINRLTPFNGEGSLETFLAKFEQMAKYFAWSEADKFHHMCASLQGAAAQVLWGLTPNDTVESIITLLRTRFGNELQIERFRAELQARRRKSGETLQTLYLDVVRMVLLAHPNAATDLTQHVAKEAFINALDNVALQVRVMDKQPATIEEALSIAARLEAYEMAIQTNGALPSTLSKGEGGHPKTKSVRTSDSSTAAAERSEANQSMQRQVLQMQKEFAKYRERKSLEEQPTPQPSAGAQVHSGSSRQGTTASRAKNRGRNQGRVQCANCDKFGHRTKDCTRPPRYSPPRDNGSKSEKDATV